MEIIIYKNDEQHGPLDEEEVRQAVERGEFTGDDMAWREGCESWLPLKRIVSLPAVMPAGVRMPVLGDWQGPGRSTRQPEARAVEVSAPVGKEEVDGRLVVVLAGVRGRTAYRGARTMVSAPFNIMGGTMVVLGLAMVIGVAFNVGALAAGFLVAAGLIIAGMFLLGLAALASAVFDLADAALLASGREDRREAKEQGSI